jgi:N-methylhydantoinase A
MGGTTAKASLITDGVAPIEEGYVIGDPSPASRCNCPLSILSKSARAAARSPGSTTAAGFMSAQCAGADPGPACYGKGSAIPSSPTPTLRSAASIGNRFLERRHAAR